MDEFTIAWVRGGSYAEVTVPSGTALKTKLLKYARDMPNEVNHVVENADGSLFCHVPIKFIRIGKPKQVSEENKQAARERFQKMWEERKSGE